MCKTICKTNIRKALRESFRDYGGYYDVTDEWQVSIRRDGVFHFAELWKWDDGTSLRVRFCGTETVGETLDYATTLLMREYDKQAA